MSKLCPVCARETSQPYGDINSDILFIGSVANEDDVRYGRPFSGKVYPIFKRMVYKNSGIDLSSTRQVSLWYHAKPDSKKEALIAVDCFVVSKDIVLKEMLGKRLIVLVGADTCREFTGRGVDDISGLDVTPFVEDSGSAIWFAIPKETQVFRDWGQLELDLKKLAICMEKLK